MSVAGDVEIRPYRPGDEAGLVDCYNRVFAGPGGSHAPEDLASWSWKFGQSTARLIQIVVAEHQSEGIVGAYPCQPLRVWMDGCERLSAQIVDLMVRPEFRRCGGRPGLFVALGRRFYELYCGDEPGKQVFNYGWPVPAWRMGQRYLGYLNIRDWNFLGREIEADRSALRDLPGAVETVEVRAFSAEVDALFEGLKTEAGLTLVRDARYLNWRYASPPHKTYRLYECRERSSGALRGIAVYTVGDFIRARTSYLVDWLVRADDADAVTSMVGTAEHQAFADETGAIAGIWNPVDPRFEVLQRMGYRLRDSGYFLVVATFKYPTRFFRDGWIFTMGDSDLI